MNQIDLRDIDPLETEEWVDATTAVAKNAGGSRAHYLIDKVIEQLSRIGNTYEPPGNTPYKNTISPDRQHLMPGDHEVQGNLNAAIRWNSIVQVIRANRKDKSLGGHLASYMSASTLYEVGFNHFFRGSDQENGDLIYFQGHISPGIYARSYLEGRFTEEQMDNFRQETGGSGLPSYPHPHLLPDYWQFPTVSMGLGPIQAIYQAHLMKYLDSRGLQKKGNRKIWAFLGDGECDEVETLGALGLASREKLDNLIFVINCNLQRLDGPVRGNGKIIDELERIFSGNGWRVIKLIWGSNWDQLFSKDSSGVLLKRMSECVDGEYQSFRAQGGAYTRKNLFGKYPELELLIHDWNDEQIEQLNCGGHDPEKVYAAYYEAANNPNGRPVVILAHTVKGYGMGIESGEAGMEAHNIKSMSIDGLKRLRDRLNIPITDEVIDSGEVPYYKPDKNSREIKYLLQTREKLGGFIPKRHQYAQRVEIPDLDNRAFSVHLKGSGDRPLSTTMIYSRILGALVKDKSIGKRIVPIVPDEARTFGMEGMFRQVGIYATEGQKYEPMDAGQLMYYREDVSGQILEEGITESGAMCAWIAAATSYSNNKLPLIPFYTFYAMFGFQRVGDLSWLAGDIKARGFLVGGTAGRTTINGEGLQHQDGHSHILASTIPTCRSYDPAYGFELVHIIHDGMRRMFQENEECFYYITVMNENYVHPACPRGAEQGIIKGMYILESHEASGPRVQLLGSGAIVREAQFAAELLKQHFGISSDVWSVTSFNELRRECLQYERAQLIGQPAPEPWVTLCLKNKEGPVIAASDYMKLYSDQIRAWIPAPYYVLGTDGFGRSDTREKLRHHFEVDRYFISLQALRALVKEGRIDQTCIETAITLFNIHQDKPYPPQA